ncbi:MAG: hypothetical protein K0B09_09660, partial [Bacteroidales bacterium]|nr:hypothetical protein [Bacteroidales bacterium]
MPQSKNPAVFIIAFFLALAINAQPLNQREAPSALYPVFSHPAGFYTSNFELGISTSQTGVYDYTVAAPGYESVTGNVSITDSDLEVVVTLGGKAHTSQAEKSDFSKEVFNV